MGDNPVSQGYNPGDAAHHLVEQGRAGAQAARDILQKWGIDIQSHYNGLWLDNTTHYTTFRSVYTDYVYQRLFAVDPLGREAVLQALKDIATNILTGLIP
ncbi:MAG: AHH domain-containing protein [Bellilinea sp.]